MTLHAPPVIQIRPYVAADRRACIAVFRSNLPRYFDSSELPEFEAFLDKPIGDYFVLELGSYVVACGGCYVRAGTGRLSWGMVSHENHRASIGTILLAWRIDQLFQLPEISEIAIDTSQHVAGFFTRHGFCTTGQVTDGFGAGIDQVCMSLQRNNWRVRASSSLQPATAGGD